MTTIEARKHAKRQWGPSAYVKMAKHGPNRYCVGVSGNPGTLYGFGPTWEAAFEYAARELRPKKARVPDLLDAAKALVAECESMGRASHRSITIDRMLAAIAAAEKKGA